MNKRRPELIPDLVARLDANDMRLINDDGTLKRTGERPIDWSVQAAKPGNGSDK